MDRIRAVEPARVEVIHRPELLPPTRYVADHVGAPFTRTAEQERHWVEALRRAEILWDLPPRREDVEEATRLRWIQTTSTGVGPSVEALGLQHSDVLITTARGVHAGPLAEFVFMALLAHFRGLRHLDAEQKQHRWIRYCGEEVAGRTLVTIGAGDLARGVAKIGRALDMRIVGIARDPAKFRAHGDLFNAILPVSDMHGIFREADAVVLTLPQTAETTNLLDAAALASFKPGCAFVNIGRGQVVDEAALVEQLRAGRIGFAALDVATVEPLPADSPLWDMPNVLISPHSASTVSTENRKIVDIFCENLRCYLDARLDDMRNILDKARMY